MSTEAGEEHRETATTATHRTAIGFTGEVSSSASGEARGMRKRVSLHALLSVVLCALTLAVFWSVTGYGFLSYDDDIMVWRNPWVTRGLTADGVGWALTTFEGSSWSPLTWLSHMTDVQLFGLDAGRHHLMNLLFHVVNVLLVFLVLSRMTGAPWRSALAAGLFGVHPQRVESVAWIAERKDMLFVCLGLLALAAYLSFVRKGGWCRYSLVGACYALGLAAKPMLMTLPIVLLLIDYWPLARIRSSRAAGLVPGSKAAGWAAGRALVVEKIPLLCLSLASLVVTVAAQGDALVPLDSYPLASRVANMLNSLLSYVEKTVWPANLAVLYPLQTSFPAARTAVALLLIVLLLVLALRERQRRPAVCFGWLFFLVTIAPVSGIAPLGFQAMADRFTYLPHVGLFVAVAWLVGEYAARSRTTTVVIAALCVTAVGMFAAQAGRQVLRWRDDEQLFRHALAVAPHNHVALSNLANALIEKGKLEEGIDVARQSLALRPREPVGHNNLGIVLAKMGRAEEARLRFETALQLDPNYVPAMLNLGNLSSLRGRHDEAADQYRKALRHRPSSAEAHIGLGVALLSLNRLDEARRSLEEAVRLAPYSRKARANLHMVVRRLEERERAKPRP